MGAEAYTWVTKYKKNKRYWRCCCIIAAFVAIFGLTACSPSSSTGKKPEFYYKDAKVIELCNAISRNDEAAVDELLKQGVNINAIGKDGMTPLFWAFTLNCKKRFEMVLRKGGNPNIRTKIPGGISVMTLAVRHKDIDYLKLALTYGGNPNYQDLNFQTLIFEAIMYNDAFEKVKLLIDFKADINHQDLRKITPLHVALSVNRYDIAYYLLQKGADYTIKNGVNHTFADLCVSEYQLKNTEYKLYPYLLKCIDFLKERGVVMDLNTPFKSKADPPLKNPDIYWKKRGEICKKKTFKHNGSKPTIYDPIYPE